MKKIFSTAFLAQVQYLSVLVLFLSFPLFLQAQIDSTFNASVTEGFGYVNETVVQPDGKIVAVGLFQRANGARANGIARFNADGTLDAAFNNGGAGANAAIYAVALQSGGKIIVAGAFTSFNNQAINRLIRLNADGSLDATFNSNTAFNGQINDVLVQPDDKILVVGAFTAPASRRLRLNADGSIDPTFITTGTVNGNATSAAFSSEGKIIIAGSFSIFGGVSRRGIVRLEFSGNIDQSFISPATMNGVIYKIFVQPDGKILLGGYIITYNNKATDGLVRLNSNGSLDLTFEFTTDEVQIRGLAAQSDGKIIAGIANDSANIAEVIRFNQNGTKDLTFQTGNTEYFLVRDIKLLSDNRLLVAGDFLAYANQAHFRLARVNADGSVDNGFNASISTLGAVYAVKRQTDGKILIGGDFEFVNGVRKSAIARLNTDGSIDNSFNSGAGFNSDVFALLIQPDGKIVVGGFFLRYNNNPTYAVARINSDGSFDANLNFDSRITSIAYALALQPDGKILVGGQISDNSGDLFAANRINADGSLDTSFNPSVLLNGVVTSILVQPSGKIIIGGTFFSQGTFQRNGIARLNADGTLDNAFTAAAPNTFALAQQADGKFYAGGASGLTRFTSEGAVDSTFNTGSGVNGVNAIEIQPDGKIIIGGAFLSYNGTTVNRIARVNPDGSIDTTFNAGTGASGNVLALALQPDGKILVGGRFSDFNNTEKFSLVRLQSAANSARTLFDFDGDGKADVSVVRPSNGAWYLQQSANGFAGVTFGFGSDKITPADYDGDGKTDVAVYRPANGTWYLLRSQLGFTALQFGAADDIPAPADYDGDGKADVAVFRPSNGTWYIQQSSLGFVGAAFGASGDRPVAADYDGDGRADIAVFRPSNGTWYLQRSMLGFTGVQFGEGSDKAVPADYDGDGKADVAIFRPSNGVWYLLRSQQGFTGIAFGLETDLPTPADYDGDGKADVAVFRDGTWYLQRSTQGFTGVSFGAATDRPVPNAFVP